MLYGLARRICGSFAPLLVQPLADLPPWQFNPWLARPLACLTPGLFAVARWMIRPIDTVARANTAHLHSKLCWCPTKRGDWRSSTGKCSVLKIINQVAGLENKGPCHFSSTWKYYFIKTKKSDQRALLVQKSRDTKQHITNMINNQTLRHHNK